MTTTLHTITCPKCPHCGIASTMPLAEEVITRLNNRFASGELIQDILPAMSLEQREMIITGTHPECWDAMFAYLDED